MGRVGGRVFFLEAVEIRVAATVTTLKKKKQGIKKLSFFFCIWRVARASCHKFKAGGEPFSVHVTSLRISVTRPLNGTFFSGPKIHTNSSIFPPALSFLSFPDSIKEKILSPLAFLTHFSGTNNPKMLSRKIVGTESSPPISTTCISLCLCMAVQ